MTVSPLRQRSKYCKWSLHELGESLDTACADKSALAVQLAYAEEQYKKQGDRLKSVLRKLTGSEKIRNLQRKVERRDKAVVKKDSIISELNEKCNQESAQISEMEESLKKLNSELSEMKAKCEKLSKDKLALQKKISYLKKSNKSKLQAIMEENIENIVDMEQNISKLREENNYLTELQDFLSKEVTVFENGRYANSIREVVMGLLGENVGVKHIAPVIRLVLKRVANLDCSRLPSAALINTIQAECKFISKVQVAHAILGTNSTLHSDGASKLFRHYQGFQVTNEGSALTMGLQEVSGGDADTNVEAFLQEIRDLSAFISENEEERLKTEAQLLQGIKNTMSDRHIVNKVFNEKLYEIRAKALPTAIPNFIDLEQEDRRRLLRMNHRFCGMHLIVNLASVAEQSLCTWEKIVSDNQKLGAAAVSGFFPSKSESGVQRFVRTSCKALEIHGSEQSGVGLQFNTYLCGKGVKSELVSFRGNRFNIIFRNGGAVFYHRNDIKTFLTHVWGTPNKLLIAVLADVLEISIVAGARALGIVSKMVTTPLWKLLESNVHIEDMPHYYLMLRSKCEKWAQDSSPLLYEGDCVFPEIEINRDHVFEELFKEHDENLDSLTLEALQMIMASFVLLINRQVGEAFLDGEVSSTSDEIRTETKSMPKTNTISERDFGQLDLIKRTKPNISVLGMEASIMFSNNRTSNYLDTLDPKKKAKLLDDARKQGPKILAAYKERKQVLMEKRLATLKAKEDAKRKKEVDEMEEKTKLTNAVAKSGGLWTVEDIDLHLSRDDKSLTDELKSQLKMRKLLLGGKPPNKELRELFQFSKGGVKFTNDELGSNLKQIVRFCCNVDASPVSMVSMVSEGEEDTVDHEALQRRKRNLQLELDRLSGSAEEELVKVKSQAAKRDKKRIGVERTLEMD